MGILFGNMQIGESNEDVNYVQEKPKGIGNSITLPYDYGSLDELEVVLVELAQKVAYRLRKEKMYASVVNVHLKNNEFKTVSHQKKLMYKTDTTNDILDTAKELLKELYTGDLIRLIGVRVDGLVELQLSIFDQKENSKNRKLDETLDKLKEKFGYEVVTRATELREEKN